MELMYKLLKYTGCILVGLGMFSCQDFDRPEMNIIPDPEPTPYDPLKIYIPFDENKVDDKSIYEFKASAVGISYVDGISGKSMKGAEGGYVLVNIEEDLNGRNLKDSLQSLDAFTVSFWMNLKSDDVNGGARQLFTIPHSEVGWGNLDIFTDGATDEGVLFKVHMFNTRSGSRVDGWIDDCRLAGVLDKWTHMVFRYEGASSTLHVFCDGKQVYEKLLGDYGKLIFEKMSGSFIVGNFSKNINPPLTSDSDTWDWAKEYNGELDQFRFYNSILTNEEVETLYKEKK
ncbi:LamG-like jellyroll fold domain-containing protein [Parabacteroides sp.]|uniref:LamG-like jellyroll fold domain-containing protein n=1 Tax=Parabacteroides sp. TaxID=1869337 RepID=UPI003080D82F